MHIVLTRFGSYTGGLENAPEETEVELSEIGKCHRLQATIVNHPYTALALEAARTLREKIDGLPGDVRDRQLNIIRTHLTREQLIQLGIDVS